MAASAYDQAQSLSQQYQQAQEQLGQRFQQEEQQLNQQYPGQQPGPGYPIHTKAPGIFEQHLQNPHVQQALGVIGKFLGDIGHPLAGAFQGIGQSLGGVSPAARVGPVGQAVGQGVNGVINMYAQGAATRPNPLPQMAGQTAPGAQMSAGLGVGAPGVPQVTH